MIEDKVGIKEYLGIKINYSNEKNLEDNSSGQFRTKRNVFFYELGFGIDLYLEWFKFTPSIRGVFAISDELVRDDDPLSPWTGNVRFYENKWNINQLYFSVVFLLNSLNIIAAALATFKLSVCFKLPNLGIDKRTVIKDSISLDIPFASLPITITPVLGSSCS